MTRNGPRRHHYVAQFHQKHFADNDGRLWVYDRRERRYRKIHPLNICCEKELYTIDPEGRRNRYVEQEWLSRVDGDAASALRQFETGVLLDDEWKESFSVFMAQQITRGPAFRNLTFDNFRLMREQFLRIGLTDVVRARQLLENYRGATRDPAAERVTAEQLVEDVAQGRVPVTVGNESFLIQMVRQVESLARWIVGFDWEVVQSPAETGFILSDYPFVLVPPSGRPDAFGLGFPGTTKYFPLTRRLCLRMKDPGYAFSYRRVDKHAVRIINQNLAVNSERFIMGPSREQLEHVVSRSGTQAMPVLPRTMSHVVETDRDRGLIGFTFWPNRIYFDPLP